ncbi:MAG: bifunctional phosphoglucose/phosphomannose isomerase [Desulfitobacteriaceae bacterium]|nr:bifunctional phosphoglucose/phosphomannose isomerase [Desulfitobacteriaceae bacterium]MDD4753365.1 bifunctional phosphoglucose/phosphomannose isomerase [Desulfitobacteriaceae bacterium]
MKYSVDLDREEDLKKADPEKMLDALAGLADQCRRAVELAGKVDLDFTGTFHNIVVTGLGGSAIGGDFLRVLAGEKMNVPVAVNRSYTLPCYVNKESLVFAVSYSGNTEETLSAYEDAKMKGAAITVITGGGKLAEKARQDGVPLISVPSGLQPRAATGYLFLPMVIVAAELGLIPDPKEDLADLIRSLEEIQKRLTPKTGEKENPAKQLAKLFYEKIPVIWGASGTTETAAMRWKGQINENSKAPAYFNVLPELNHNEIVGTEVPGDILEKVELVFLRDWEDHPRVAKRFEITKEIIGDRVSGVTEVWGEGNCLLSRMMTVTYIGDYTSAYLALLYGIDPSPVKLITLLKNKLAEV